MKAIWLVHEFGGPEVLSLEEVPTPSPGPGQVLVKVHAAGVNPYDTYMRSGNYAIKPQLPYTPGSDAAGIVEAVGAGVAECEDRRPRVYSEDDYRSIRRVHINNGGAGQPAAAKRQLRSRRGTVGALRHRLSRPAPGGKRARWRNGARAWRKRWSRDCRGADRSRHRPDRIRNREY